MAGAKAIIASDLPVLKEILDDKIALFADPEDANSWANKIEQLSESTLRRKLGEAANERFLLNYTWERRVEAIEPFFSDKKPR